MADAPDVKLYALSTCGHCKNTKKLLDDSSIDYESVDVDRLGGHERQAVIEEVRELNPRVSFPTLKIDDKVIVGYMEDEIKEALGVL